MKEAPFYVGQKVIRIGMSFPPIIEKGKIYTVSKLKQCGKCGNWKVCCSEFPPAPVQPDDNCSCGEPNKYDGRYYGRYEGFAPIEENHYEDVTKELAVLPTEEVPDVKQIKELVN